MQTTRKVLRLAQRLHAIYELRFARHERDRQSGWQRLAMHIDDVECLTNIQPVPETLQLFSPPPLDSPIAIASPWEPFAETWDWDDLDREFLEDFEPHEPVLNHDQRA